MKREGKEEEEVDEEGWGGRSRGRVRGKTWSKAGRRFADPTTVISAVTTFTLRSPPRPSQPIRPPPP